MNVKNTTRAPLLLTAGTKDHTVPLSQVTVNYHKYRQTPARTDFLRFEGRTHWHIKQEGWEEVAQQIAAWLTDVGVGSTNSIQIDSRENLKARLRPDSERFDTASKSLSDK